MIASNSASPQLDFSYFVTPNIWLNLIAAGTQHDVSLRGSALGDVRLGHVRAPPPTLAVRYQPLSQARISPYVGLGLKVTWFYGEVYDCDQYRHRLRAGAQLPRTSQ